MGCHLLAYTGRPKPARMLTLTIRLGPFWRSYSGSAISVSANNSDVKGGGAPVCVLSSPPACCLQKVPEGRLARVLKVLRARAPDPVLCAGARAGRGLGTVPARGGAWVRAGPRGGPRGLMGRIGIPGTAALTAALICKICGGLDFAWSAKLQPGGLSGRPGNSTLLFPQLSATMTGTVAAVTRGASIRAGKPAGIIFRRVRRVRPGRGGQHRGMIALPGNTGRGPDA
jgi:hypothetical protein